MRRAPVLVAVVTALILASTFVGAVPAPAASAATLKADYRFQDSHLSSVPGAPALTDLGPGTNAFATETVDGGDPQRVLTFPQGNGVQLTGTAGVIPNASYTIAVLARLTTTSGYRRYLDFKNGTSDTGLYNLSGALVFYNAAFGSTGAISPDVYALVVLTRSAAGQVVGYVDGAQQFSFDDSGGSLAVISSDDVLRFFRDNETGANTEHSAGAVARIRLWDGPLSGAQVAALSGRVTSMQVSCLPNPVAVGAATTCTASVTDARGGTPTGSISFGRNSSGAFSAPSCTVAGTGPGQAACSVDYTPGAFDSGSHRIYASYSGDRAPAYGFTDVGVTGGPPRPSATTVSCSPPSVMPGGTTTCTATVADAGGYTKTVPTGTVSFGHNSSGTFSATGCALVPAGPAQASCSVDYMPAAIQSGIHKIYAAYAGDHAASTGSTTVGVFTPTA